MSPCVGKRPGHTGVSTEGRGGMKKRMLGLLAGVLFSGASLFGASFTIGGSVKQPLNLSTEKLGVFKTVRVQQNEILRDGSYRGSWHFDGVPLRTLLEAALVEKEDSGFAKMIDLAVVVRNREGLEVAFSWGEIFFRNSADVIIATSAVPIRPRHKSDATERYAEQFNRKIGFPKLVAAADDYADRSIENVVSIEVVNLRPGVGSKKMEKLFAPSFSVTGAGARGRVIDTLAGLPRRELRSAHMGEGRATTVLTTMPGRRSAQSSNRRASPRACRTSSSFPPPTATAPPSPTGRSSCSRPGTTCSSPTPRTGSSSTGGGSSPSSPPPTS